MKSLLDLDDLDFIGLFLGVLVNHEKNRSEWSLASSLIKF